MPAIRSQELAFQMRRPDIRMSLCQVALQGEVVQARRAVLQDLANNPSRPSANIAIPRAVSSSPGDELAPAGRTDSARDDRALARGGGRGPGGGASDSSAPSGSAHWPDQASADVARA